MRVGDDEAHIHGDGPDIANVVIDALQFQQDGSHELGAGGDFHPAGLFHRLAEGRGVGKRRVARYALRQEHALLRGEPFEELLRPLVGVEHAELQVQDGLARDGEVEVAGFDDAGVYRSHGDLEDAFPQRRTVDVLLALESRQLRIERKILAQRVYVGPVVVQRHAPRIGVAFGFDAEPVLDLAFLPVDGREAGGERWKPRILGWNARAEDQITRVAAPLEDIIVVECRLALHAVFREYGGEARGVAAAKRLRDGRDIGYGDAGAELVRVGWRRGNAAVELLRQLFQHFPHGSASGHHVGRAAYQFQQRPRQPESDDDQDASQSQHGKIAPRQPRRYGIRRRRPQHQSADVQRRAGEDARPKQNEERGG